MSTCIPNNVITRTHSSIGRCMKASQSSCRPRSWGASVRCQRSPMAAPIRHAYARDFWSRSSVPMRSTRGFTTRPTTSSARRDLGYYVGYEIAEGAYRRATNKHAVVKELLELDYTNRDALARLVDASGYFERPLLTEMAQYEARLPYVVSVPEIQNGDSAVSPSLTRITVRFSAPMDTSYRNFNRGPLGEPAGFRIRYLGFATDGMSLTLGSDAATCWQTIPAGTRQRISEPDRPPYASLLDRFSHGEVADVRIGGLRGASTCCPAGQMAGVFGIGEASDTPMRIITSTGCRISSAGALGPASPFTFSIVRAALHPLAVRSNGFPW